MNQRTLTRIEPNEVLGGLFSYIKYNDDHTTSLRIRLSHF